MPPHMRGASASFWACSPDGPLSNTGRQAICYRLEHKRCQRLLNDDRKAAAFGTSWETSLGSVRGSRQVPIYLKNGKLDVSATYASLKRVMGGPSAWVASRIALYTGELPHFTANSPISWIDGLSCHQVLQLHTSATCLCASCI